MNFYLKKVRPMGKKSLMDGAGGWQQDVLIARRIVDKCNTLIETDIITKKDGSPLKQTIGEDTMKSAGLADPGKLNE